MFEVAVASYTDEVTELEISIPKDIAPLSHEDLLQILMLRLDTKAVINHALDTVIITRPTNPKFGFEDKTKSLVEKIAETISASKQLPEKEAKRKVNDLKYF